MRTTKHLYSGWLLSLAVLLCATLIFIVYKLTLPAIVHAEQSQLNELLSTLLPVGSTDNDYKNDFILITDEALGGKNPQRVYRATLNKQPSGAIISAVAADGYSGTIKLLIGILADGSIHTVSVLAHTETPGLGDAIEATKSDWIYSFKQLPAHSLKETDWTVKKNGGQFDRITGATITSNAVIKAVKRASHWYQLNRDSLHAEHSR